ncbi:hypothetical protein DEO72_LG3g576 [Vigna unguiculata]|uniref:Ulp1 protease family n=1 Tax=Vigna unguiculata TaxID=3917 RepID=A0A4D6LCG0_VIGUN|nr:hypothetical protein DEO72_LG3g576 [Vigna unguiculata]
MARKRQGQSSPEPCNKSKKDNQVVFYWSLSEDDKKNPVVESALRIEDEATANDIGCGHPSKGEVALEEKFQKHERFIMDMKVEIKNMYNEFFGIDEPHPSGGEGNDFNEGQGHVLDLGLGTPCQQQESQEEVDNCSPSEENTLQNRYSSNYDDQISPCMAIIPSIEGQNNTMVINMGKYYRDVTTGVCSRILYPKIRSQLLSNDECHGFCPRGWINNMFVLFAAVNFVYKEKRLIVRVNSYIQSFVYVVHDGHWWCYAINFQRKEFIVLDSLPTSVVAKNK